MGDGIFGNPGAAPAAAGQAPTGVGEPAISSANGPQGSGQPGTTPAPTDGQGQQPGAPGEAGQGGPEQLILGKFRTPEEAYKAYQNIEPRLTQVTQENARLRAMLLSPHAQPAQPGAPAQPNMPAAVVQPGQPNLLGLTDEQLAAAWEQNPGATLATVIKNAVGSLMESQVKPLIDPLRTDLGRQAWNGKVNEIMANSQMFPGFTELFPQIEQVIKTNPYLLQLPGGQGLENAYYMARGMALQGVAAAAQQAGAEAAYAGIAAKGAAQVEGGSPRQPTVQKSADEQFLDRVFQTGASPVFRT